MRSPMAKVGALSALVLIVGCNMSKDHRPIDAKDDSADYRAQVWDAVRQRVGSELAPLPSDAKLSGTWDIDFEMFGSRQPMFRYEFHDDGSVTVVSLMGADQSPQTERHSVRGEGRVEISGETYHAATTEDGKLVLFNGDQSLVLVGTKRGSTTR
jgi:hypothetical protein